MPITEQSLTIEAEAQAELADRLDAHTAILAAAWIEAWNQVSVDLQDALHSLLIDAADGVISSAMVMRSERLGRALAIIANRLDVLTQQAGVVVTGDLAEIVQSAADTQQAIVASMLPEDWDTSSWTYANPATLDWIVQRTTQQITSQLEPLSDEATVGMHAELIRGVAARSNPRQVADRMLERVEGRFNGGLARTLVISRTELLDAHRAGGAAAHDANAELLAGWVWLCHLGPRTCRACIGKHGTLHPVSEPGPLGHQQCVLPGAVVSGPRAQASTTRWFDGEVIDIETVEGRFLSVTPNHPVLTTKGWVSAGQLREGDHVIAGSGIDGPAVGRRPDDHQIPALIEDVAETLGSALPVDAVSVPTAAEDFHGDGAGSDVHVVRAHSLLGDHRDAPKPKLTSEPGFMVGDVRLPLLSSEGGLALCLERFRDAALSIVRGLDQPLILVRGATLRHESVGARDTTPRHTCGVEPVVDRVTRDAEGFGQSVARLPGFVSGDDQLGGQVRLGEDASGDPVRAKRDRVGPGAPQAALLEDPAQALLAYPIPTRDDLVAFTGDVVADRVLNVFRRRFAGHVYNLQTATGWFVANQIVTHNCRCSRQPRVKSWADLGVEGLDDLEPPDALPDADVFFRSLPVADQKAILGERGYALWKSGRWPRSEWAKLVKTSGWRDSWTAAAPPK